MGAKIFLIVECFPLLARNSLRTFAALIPFPATPTLPIPSEDGIIHAKNPGYFF